MSGLKLRSRSIGSSWTFGFAALGCLAIAGCGGAATTTSQELARETVTSQETSGNHKVTKGTAVVDLEGDTYDDELTFEEDDILDDSDPNVDDSSFTITANKSRDSMTVGLDDDMAHVTIKHGVDTQEIALAPGGTILWNGQPISPADVEAKVKSSLALMKTSPAILTLAGERLGEGSFTTEKSADDWLFFNTWLQGVYYLSGDWTWNRQSKVSSWVICKCLGDTFPARCKGPRNNGSINF